MGNASSISKFEMLERVSLVWVMLCEEEVMLGVLGVSHIEAMLGVWAGLGPLEMLELVLRL